ncbi:L,D-transpeptidase [Bacillaceae bacterium SIJ1]|uniref:L,D-transpeptidase n=1 Tax=Litoribacterium kuwaitense TaxID=1398745 RepID=UPI0013EACA56|nr:L,D-transpeptidase [Litoribacterium kuwaitense]NGP43628.1 L,D-transpeptidase [Litoribacterium kuwaitense]
MQWFNVIMIGVMSILTISQQHDVFIIVSKAKNELAYFEKGSLKYTVPVATGLQPDDTPEGIFTVVVKAADPYDRKRDIPGGVPENPLGSRWIGLDARETDGRIYGIHGNNNPASIGQRVTNGCVRLHEADIQRLFAETPYGTHVLITSEDSSYESLAEAYFNRSSQRSSA